MGREVAWVAAGQGASVLAMVVGVRLLTETLSPGSYGRLALGLTVVGLAQQLVVGPIANALMRWYSPARESGALRAYLAAGRGLLARATLALAGVFAVCAVALAVTGHRDWASWAVPAGLLALVSGVGSVLDGVQNAARQRRVVALHQGVGQWLRVLLALAGVRLLAPTAALALWGYAAAAVVVLVSQAAFFRLTLADSPHAPPAAPEEVERWRGRLWAYAWPFVTWGLFSWAHFSSDRWALQAFGSSAEVGRYAVVYQLGYYPLTLLTIVLGQLVEPLLFHRAGDGTDPGRTADARRLNNRVVAGAVAVSSVGMLVAAFLHGWIFRLLAAPEYRDVSWLLPWVVLAGGIYAASQLAVGSLLVGTDTRVLIGPKIGTAVAGVLFSVVGARTWGIEGVVAGTLASSVVSLVWVLWTTERGKGARVSIDGGPGGPLAEGDRTPR